MASSEVVTREVGRAGSVELEGADDGGTDGGADRGADGGADLGADGGADRGADGGAGDGADGGADVDRGADGGDDGADGGADRGADDGADGGADRGTDDDADGGDDRGADVDRGADGGADRGTDGDADGGDDRGADGADDGADGGAERCADGGAVCGADGSADGGAASSPGAGRSSLTSIVGVAVVADARGSAETEACGCLESTVADSTAANRTETEPTTSRRESELVCWVWTQALSRSTSYCACCIACSNADTSMLSNVTGGSLARLRATNVGVSVPFSCINRTISSTLCVVLCGPCRFRCRVQFSSAHSSKSRRFEASMSPSWKVAVHKSAMAVGGRRSILFCTKQSSSSMITPLLLSVTVAVVLALPIAVA